MSRLFRHLSPEAPVLTGIAVQTQFVTFLFLARNNRPFRLNPRIVLLFPFMLLFLSSMVFFALLRRFSSPAIPTRRALAVTLWYTSFAKAR